jgi:hypothetical protein
VSQQQQGGGTQFTSLTSSNVQGSTPDLRSCVPGLGGVSVASAHQQLLSLLALGCHMSHVTPAAAVAAAAATAGVAVRARTATSGTQFTCFTSTRVQILTHARDASTAAPTESSALRGARALDCTSECWYYGVIQEP